MILNLRLAFLLVGMVQCYHLGKVIHLDLGTGNSHLVEDLLLLIRDLYQIRGNNLRKLYKFYRQEWDRFHHKMEQKLLMVKDLLSQQNILDHLEKRHYNNFKMVKSRHCHLAACLQSHQIFNHNKNWRE